MIIWLAELRPGLTADGTEQVLRFSNSSLWTKADGEEWKPRLTMPYRRGTQVFDGGFQDQPDDFAALEFALSKGDSALPLTGMVWDGRRVRIWRGAVGQNTAAMELMFDGTAVQVSGNKKRIAVTLKGPNLDAPVLQDSYAGTGLAEGPAELKGTLKPMLIGTGMNLEPTYVNRALGIFQYHAYGNLVGYAPDPTVLNVYDSGSQLGTTIGDYATYAALAAAVVPAGRFATCNALGMGRHGGDITGILTIDARGAISGGLAGDILYYLTYTRAGLAGGKIEDTDLVWLNGQVPHAQDIYITEQETIEELCRRLMLTLGGYVWYTNAGRFTVGLVRRGGASTIALNRLNIAEGSRFLGTSSPVYKRRQGYQRSWRKHSYSEVRTPKEINPRGAWNAAPNPVYQYYDKVEHENASWVYTASVAGNAAEPGDDPAVWTLFTTNGAAIVDSATTPAGPVEGLLWRNTTTGLFSWFHNGVWTSIADITAANIAAGFSGQAPVATDQDALPRILSMRGDNVLRNSNFMEGSTGHTLAGGLTVVSLPPGSPSLFAFQFPAGGSGEYSYVSSAWQPYTFPYRQAFVSLVVNPASVASQITISIWGFDAAGNQLTSSYSSVIVGAHADWQTYNLPVINLPEGTASIGYVTMQRTGANGANLRVTNIRVAPTMRAATIGAVAGLNHFREDGVTVMSEAEVRTLLGISSGFSGQTDWATYGGINTSNMAGRVQFLSSGGNLDNITRISLRPITSLFRADGATGVTEAAVVTALGLSSGFAGQTDWATYGGISTTNMAGRVQYMSSAGLLDSLSRVTARPLTLLFRADGSTPLSDALVVTALGISSGFSGQAPIATDQDAIPRILSMRGDNFIRNSSFYEGNTGLYFGSGTAQYAGLGAGWPAASSLLFLPNATVNDSYAYYNGSEVFPFPFRRAYFSAQFYNGGATTDAQLVAQCFDAADGYISAVSTGRAIPPSTPFTTLDFPPLNLPAGTAKINIYIQRTTAHASGLYVTNARFAPTARAATLGATASVDTFRADAVTVMTEAEVRTLLGISSGYTGQTDWGTYGGISTTNMAGRVQGLQTGSGRFIDGRYLNSANLFGLRALIDTVPTLSDTDNTGTVTINIGSSTWLTDWGTSITFPSGSVSGISYGATVYLWRNQGDPTSTGTSYGASTNMSDALGTGKVFLGSFITRASGGVPPPPPPPSPWEPNCVAASSQVLTTRGWVPARDVVEGDQLWVLCDDREGGRWERCTGNHVDASEAVRLTSVSGVQLDLSVTTPITTLVEGEKLLAPEAGNRLLPVWLSDDLAWERVSVEHLGTIEVAHIRCSQHTYLAGNRAGSGIFTHNPSNPKP